MADTQAKTTEDAKKKYAYDLNKYNPNMALKDGRVNHEEAMSLPTVKEATFLMNVSWETAIIHVNEGAKALENPALKPLLELAAAG